MELFNPPLIDIRFKIWWHLHRSEELIGTEFIKSDIFDEIRNSFPIRTLTEPESFNQGPVYIYSRDIDNLQIKISNTSLSIVSNQEKYYWESFRDTVQKVVEFLLKHLEIIKPDHFHLELCYVDFFKNHHGHDSVLSFLNESLNTNLSYNYCKEDELTNFNLSFKFKTQYGTKILEFGQGSYNGESGYLVQSKAESSKVPFNVAALFDWLYVAHEDCSKTFKEFTKGKLYDSFSEKT